jgi:hypothetical protein
MKNDGPDGRDLDIDDTSFPFGHNVTAGPAAPGAGIITPQVPSVSSPTPFPVGMDHLGAFIRDRCLDAKVVRRYFRPVRTNPALMFHLCPDRLDGRGVRLLIYRFDTTSFDRCVILLRFSPNRVLHGVNHKPAIPGDADRVLDAVDEILARCVPDLGLLPARSPTWTVCGVDFNIDLVMDRHERDLLLRGLKVLPFKFAKVKVPYEFADPSILDAIADPDDELPAGVESIYFQNRRDRPDLVHVLYDKEAEVRKKAPAHVHEVRGVVRDEVRLRRAGMLRRIGLDHATVEQALRFEDRMAAFRLVLARHGIDAATTATLPDRADYFAAIRSAKARVRQRAMLLHYSFGRKETGFPCLPGSDAHTMKKNSLGNARRKMVKAGVYHFDPDADGVLRSYARTIYGTPPGFHVHLDDPVVNPSIDAICFLLTKPVPPRARKAVLVPVGFRLPPVNLRKRFRRYAFYGKAPPRPWTPWS